MAILVANEVAADRASGNQSDGAQADSRIMDVYGRFGV
jgi:hypothetical protein